MVKLELKNGKIIKNVKYKLLVRNVKFDMKPIRDLRDLSLTMNKSEFVKACLNKLGKDNSIKTKPSDLLIPTFKDFSAGIISALSNEKSTDHLFLSHKFTGYGWRLAKIDARTDITDIRRIQAKHDELKNQICGGMEKKKELRYDSCGIPYDEREALPNMAKSEK